MKEKLGLYFQNLGLASKSHNLLKESSDDQHCQVHEGLEILQYIQKVLSLNALSKEILIETKQRHATFPRIFRPKNTI